MQSMPLAFVQADYNFLLERVEKAGTCSFEVDRDTGVSSNSIVAIAYRRLPLELQAMPGDISDLNACVLAYKKLPAHRKGGIAMGGFGPGARTSWSAVFGVRYHDA